MIPDNVTSSDPPRKVFHYFEFNATSALTQRLSHLVLFSFSHKYTVPLFGNTVHHTNEKSGNVGMSSYCEEELGLYFPFICKNENPSKQ